MTSFEPSRFTRRAALQLLAGSAATVAVPCFSSTSVTQAAESNVPTASQFQIACMTLPYSRFPLRRALQGIKTAGYEFVAWGTTHIEGSDNKSTPVLANDASLQTAAKLGQQCREMGLKPVMMFSMVYPEHDDGLDVLTQRIRQASAAGIGQVLTFGHTEGGSRKLWVERFTKLGPIARDHGVTLVVKQHGGSTGTGEACADIIREVNDPGVRVNYDAGNVMDYLNVDPIPDIHKCADVVHSFCIKDHRNWPVDQDCGPGLGEIDHYRLLSPVARLGRTIPLCCENIFPPILKRPDRAEEVDAYAKHARVFLETVVAGLQHVNEF